MNIENNISKDKTRIYIESIPDKNTRTKKGILNSYVTLSYILFIKKDNCYIDLLDPITKLEFINYETWIFIEKAIALKSYITNDSYEKELLKNKLLYTLEIGNEIERIVSKNVHLRFVQGDFIGETYINNGNITEQTNNKIKYLMNLIKLDMFIDEKNI